MSTPVSDAALRDAAERATPDMVRFLQAMIAIPSESAEEAGVVACVAPAAPPRERGAAGEGQRRDLAPQPGAPPIAPSPRSPV